LSDPKPEGSGLFQFSWLELLCFVLFFTTVQGSVTVLVEFLVGPADAAIEPRSANGQAQIMFLALPTALLGSVTGGRLARSLGLRSGYGRIAVTGWVAALGLAMMLPGAQGGSP